MTLVSHPRHVRAGRSLVEMGGRPLLVAVLVQGTALTALVARDGSLAWRTARIVIVVALSLLAAWRVGAGGRREAGGVALVTGTVGTVAGAGTGGGHLLAGHVSPVTVAGLVALGSGLVLMAAGATILVQSLRGWQHLLAVPPGLALLIFVLYPVTLAVAATNAPPTDVTTTPTDRGLVAEDIDFPASDGVRLSGWYVPSSNRAAVVLVHDDHSTRTAVLDQAAVLAEHGYGVLLFDARGHGRSDGTAMEFGWYGDADIAGAVNYLTDHPDVDPTRIGAVGVSMGGEEAIGAAGSDRRLQAVVAEGVTGRQLADHGWLPGGIDGLVQRGIEWVQFTAADLLSGASRPASLPDALAATPAPVLLFPRNGSGTKPPRLSTTSGAPLRRSTCGSCRVLAMTTASAASPPSGAAESPHS